MPAHPALARSRRPKPVNTEGERPQPAVRLPPSKIIRYRMLPPLPGKISISPGQPVGTAGFEPTTPCNGK